MSEQIASRLREERKRLGYATQAQLAERLDVSPGSVHNYEAGKRSPDADFLAALAGAGGDVLYILTGQRTAGVLAPDEAALLDNYRHTPEAKRHTVQEVTSAFAQYDEAVKKAKGN